MISLEFSVQWLLAVMMCGVLGLVVGFAVGAALVVATLDRADWGVLAYPFVVAAGGLGGLWLGVALL